MAGIRELAERYWAGDVDLVDEHHPVRPALGREAEEIAEGLLVLKSVASVNALDTGDGLVMLDTGDFDALPLACHLIEFAVLVEPSSAEVHALRSRVYNARSTMYDSLMARHLMSHVGLSSDQQRRDLYDDTER